MTHLKIIIDKILNEVKKKMLSNGSGRSGRGCIANLKTGMKPVRLLLFLRGLHWLSKECFIKVTF